MANDIDALKETVDRVTAKLEDLSLWYEELKDARKHVTTTTALEEQTLSIVARLNEKWRENTESIIRLRESVEQLAAHNLSMGSKFELLYDKLLDVIKCPFTVTDRRTKEDRREHGEGNHHD